jgi:hypothetical protein
MSKTNKALLVIVIVSLLLVSAIGLSCNVLSKYVGHSVDVGFLNLHHQQYDGVVSWNVVEVGLLSNTVDLYFWDGTVTRLHYVTSVTIIK